MSAEENPLIGPARKLRNHIPGCGYRFRLLHPEGNCLRGGLDQAEGVLRVNVDTGDLSTFGDIGPERFLIHIPVRIMDVPVIGDESHRAGIQQILVNPVRDAGIQQDDFSPGLSKRSRVSVGKIAQRRFHPAAAAQLIACTGNFPAVRCQGSCPNFRGIHLEGFLEGPDSPAFTDDSGLPAEDPSSENLPKTDEVSTNSVIEDKEAKKAQDDITTASSTEKQEDTVSNGSRQNCCNIAKCY